MGHICSEDEFSESFYMLWALPLMRRTGHEIVFTCANPDLRSSLIVDGRIPCEFGKRLDDILIIESVLSPFLDRVREEMAEDVGVCV